MSKRESIARHSLIINKLQKRPCTFEEIAEYLASESELQGYNFNISKRTFQRDKDEILSLYHIDIKFDFSRKLYFIDSDGEPQALNRVLEAFNTFSALNLSERIRGNIHFEDRRQQSSSNLLGLLHAIENRFKIRFTHQKYWEEEATLRLAEPYALKEYKNRWYLIAKDDVDGAIKSFGLDRMDNLDILRQKFAKPAGFSLEEMYRHCFGIVTPNGGKVHSIELLFEPFQGKYIKSLPLHNSQEIISDDDDGLRIKLHLCITHDFVMELLSYGDTVRVIKPKILADEIKETLKRALAHYKD